MWRKGMSCGRQQGTGSDLQKEIGRNEVVWMYREGSMAQRDKSAAEWHIVKRTKKYSKRGG